MKYKTVKIITAVLLFGLIAFSASAAGPPTPPTPSPNDIASAQQSVQDIMDAPVKIRGTDREFTHVWFGKIFGEFIFEPWGTQFDKTDITLLSKAVGFTNILAILLGIVIIYYLVVGGAVHTAAQGEVLGRQWSSTWIPVRTATGFFLIMPIPTIGGGTLSFSQVFILWAIILGSNGGSALWNTSVDYAFSTNPQTMAANAPNLSPGIAFSQDALDLLVCAEYSMRVESVDREMSELDAEDYTPFYMRKPGNGVTLTTGTHGTGSQVEGLIQKGVQATVYNSDAEAFSVENINLNNKVIQFKATQVHFGFRGKCGSIVFSSEDLDNPPNFAPQDYKQAARIDGMKKSRQLIVDLITKLQPLAVKIASSKDTAKATLKDLGADKGDSDTALVTRYKGIQAQFQTIATDFAGKYTPGIYAAITTNTSLQQQVKQAISKGGWASAGMWFFEINATTGATYKVFQGATKGVTVKEYSPCWAIASAWFGSDCKKIVAKFHNALELNKKIHAETVENIRSTTQGRLVTTMDEQRASCEGDCTADKAIPSQVSVSMAKWFVEYLSSQNNIDDIDTIASPFEAVSTIGHTMNSIAMGGLAVIGAMYVAKWFVSALDGGLIGNVGSGGLTTAKAKAGSAVIGVLIAMLTSIVMTLLGTGFTLAYVIPFLPITTWVLMLISYLLTTVEAVIAAPLAIVMMITPEGEGMLGNRMERALQLVVVCILKPSLMVLGLIVAVSVAGVAFSILNYFFFMTANYVLKGGLVGIIDFIAIITIYTTSAFQVCKLLIGTMHTLPNQILEWFAGGMARDFGEKEAGAHAEQATSNVGNVSDAMTNAAQSGSKALEAYREKQEKLKDKERKKK